MSEEMFHKLKLEDRPVAHTKKASRTGPSVLITAGVHGDEYEPMIAAHLLYTMLDGKLLKGQVSVVPIANPPAFRINKRCGEDGLDLARVCPGDPGGRTTEQTAFQISGMIRKADYYIDMHTGGSLLDIVPLAGYMLHGNPEVLSKQQKMADAFGLPVIWGTDPNLEGRTLSVARDAQIPAIYTEYGGGSQARKEIIDACLQGCLNVLAMLGMIESQIDENTGSPYWVEDYTRDAGYLQDKMQSPGEGYFIAEVKPGQVVTKGDIWGRVINVASGTQKTVLAKTDGLVLFIRIYSYVSQGDALGTILPVTTQDKKVIYEG